GGAGALVYGMLIYGASISEESYRVGEEAFEQFMDVIRSNAGTVQVEPDMVARGMNQIAEHQEVMETVQHFF
ncbi:MAG: hypothetical protein ABEI07_02320, partial [Candidatus Nanohaloarchaea archaeon]